MAFRMRRPGSWHTTLTAGILLFRVSPSQAWCSSTRLSHPVTPRATSRHVPFPSMQTFPTRALFSTESDSEELEMKPEKSSMMMINGEEVQVLDESHSNQEIFGATAAMVTATETPFEETCLNVQAALERMDLVNEEGLPMNTEEIASLVQGRRVALYFGAGWCPMCRDLEFMLPQYMDALKESAQSIALIYVSSDQAPEFQWDRMQKLGIGLGVNYGESANALKSKYGICSGMEAKQFLEAERSRRSGVPAFIVLDTEGNELKYLNAEAQTIAALADWPLDDPKGIF